MLVVRLGQIERCIIIFLFQNKKDANQNSHERPFMRKAKRIDFISRFAFPVAYLVFNIMFWTIALYINESHHSGRK